MAGANPVMPDPVGATAVRRLVLITVVEAPAGQEVRTQSRPIWQQAPEG
jgi:hypothetical protein